MSETFQPSLPQKLKKFSPKRKSQRKGHMTHQELSQAYNSLSDSFPLLWTQWLLEFRVCQAWCQLRVKLLDGKSHIP